MPEQWSCPDPTGRPRDASPTGGAPSPGSLSRRAFGGVAAGVALGVGTAGLAAPAHAESRYRPLTVVYVEVNNHEMINVGHYRLADGTPLFGLAMIFAANINHDGNGAVLHLNERVQATLDAADEQIRPLQAMGIKVTLSVLGNHQPAGTANFATRAAAEAFADEVAAVVDRYGLDGVDLDDEWVQYGTGDIPPVNIRSARWLVDALDERLPSDSVLSLYDIGATAETLQKAPPRTVDKLDYIWNPYYGGYNPPQFRLDRSRMGAAAVDLTTTPVPLATELATRTVEDRFGVYVTYNLTDADTSGYLTPITQQLYGQATTHTG